MPVYRNEDVKAYYLGPQSSEVVCPDCMKEADYEHVDGVISNDEIESDDLIVICDRCNAKL